MPCLGPAAVLASCEVPASRSTHPPGTWVDERLPSRHRSSHDDHHNGCGAFTSPQRKTSLATRTSVESVAFEAMLS
jgi:hypothetical protein